MYVEDSKYNSLDTYSDKNNNTYKVPGRVVAPLSKC